MKRNSLDSTQQDSSRQHMRLTTVPAARRTMAFILAAGLLLGSSGVVSFAQTLDTGTQAMAATAAGKPVRGQIAISRDVNIAKSGDKVSLNLRETELRDVLNMLAEAGHFNIIIDESVSGTLTVDIKDVSVNKALEYIFTVADLSYTKDGNTLIVASKAEAETKQLNAKTFKAIPVQFRGAQSIADTLNNTLFKIARPGGSTNAIAAADQDSNSLLVIGTDSDLKLVADTLRELDMPRNRKVYTIKHSAPDRVMTLLAANFFQNNQAAGGAAGGGAAGGGAAGGGAAGGGAAGGGAAGGGAAGGGAAGGGAAGGGAAGGGTAGGGAAGGGAAGGGAAGGGAAGGGAAGGSTTFNGGGVFMIADPVSSTLTVMATDEQLALIDSVIDQMDVRRPQVTIEVALVELQHGDIKRLTPEWGEFNLGRESRVSIGALNRFRINKNNLGFSDNFMSTFSLTAVNNKTLGKVLANPTIVAMDGTTSSVTITDQLPSVTTTVTTPTVGAPIITETITTQEAGVTLDVTPQVFNDGSVQLTLAPEVTQPIREFTTPGGGASAFLLATRSMTLAGVRVRDGETLVIGGLVRESVRNTNNKVPGLGELPIVKAMFNATSNTKDKTELVLMVTPHILKEKAVSYFNVPAGKYNNPNQGGIQPVSLPKFIGPVNADTMADSFKQNGGEAEPKPVSIQPAPPSADDKSPAEKIEMEVQPMVDLKKSMRAPKDEIIPLRTQSIQTEAFRLKSTPSPAGKSAKKSTQSMPATGFPLMMDEILKN